jgi:hypothetical protein
MKRISLTLAAAMMAAAPAMVSAETHAMTNGMSSMDMDPAMLIRTRDITGGDIYTMNEAYDEGEWMDANRWGRGNATIGNDWNDIGEIEDIVLSADGRVTGIVAEIGGFLDIGDKHVVISVSDLRLVPVDDQTYAYVTRMSEEQLEQLPGVDEGFWD